MLLPLFDIPVHKSRITTDSSSQFEFSAPAASVGSILQGTSMPSVFTAASGSGPTQAFTSLGSPLSPPSLFTRTGRKSPPSPALRRARLLVSLVLPEEGSPGVHVGVCTWFVRPPLERAPLAGSDLLASVTPSPPLTLGTSLDRPER